MIACDAFELLPMPNTIEGMASADDVEFVGCLRPRGYEDMRNDEQLKAYREIQVQVHRAKAQLAEMREWRRRARKQQNTKGDL